MTDAPRRIAITGVSRGLGRAMAEGFIHLGHTVFGCARSKEAIDELAGTVPGPSAFDVVDVTDTAQVERWAQWVLAEGPPDLLINNAAMVNRNAPLWKVPAEEFSRLIDVNIKGVAAVIRAIAPAMVERGRGVIVNLSSGWGRSVSPEVAPYCASKWAIEGMTLALAEELPKGMAAVPVNPGIIHTDMLDLCFGANAAGYPRPDAWARQAVPFLLNLGPADNGRSLTVPGTRLD